MTLVAGFSLGGLPAFVGDLLLSSLLPTSVDLPTRPQPARLPGLDRHFAASLGQKLVILRPWFMIAWAGSHSNANRIIKGIDAILPRASDEPAKDVSVFELLNSCDEDSELIALIIRDDGVHPLLARTRGFELDGKRIYLMGSGKTHAFQYLEARPEVLPGQENSDGLLARAIALRFGARAMATQWLTGSGLQESWGGGFEFAFPDQDRVFRKVDKVLFRGWIINGGGSFANVGRSFFSRYYGQDLYLSCFNPEEKTFIVPSIIGEPAKIPEYEVCSPTWTIDTFFHLPTGCLFETARFTPRDEPTADLVELVNGQLGGWRMDRAYVAGLVEAANGIAGRDT